MNGFPPRTMEQIPTLRSGYHGNEEYICISRFAIAQANELDEIVTTNVRVTLDDVTRKTNTTSKKEG